MFAAAIEEYIIGTVRLYYRCSQIYKVFSQMERATVGRAPVLWGPTTQMTLWDKCVCHWWFCQLKPLAKGSSFYPETPLGAGDSLFPWNSCQLHAFVKQLLVCYWTLTETKCLMHRSFVTFWLDIPILGSVNSDSMPNMVKGPRKPQLLDGKSILKIVAGLDIATSQF